MKLCLIGHGYRYAAEQAMLTFFPSERPEIADSVPESGAFAEVKLSKGEVWLTADVKLRYGEKTVSAAARTKLPEPSDTLSSDRAGQKVIKLAFYRAFVKLTGKTPEWGALTGVRPGKVAAANLKRGFSEKSEAKRLTRELYVSPERAEMCVSAAAEGIKIAKGLDKKDVCLYVGIPFCPTRCAYCSFVSQSIERSMSLIEPFFAALKSEISAAAEAAKKAGLRVISVYIGGGTPTTLSPEMLSELISALRTEFSIPLSCEFTVEAGRPDTVTPEKLAAMKSGGVTRISINPQTMENAVLRAIGRRHTAEETLAAFEAARNAGFNNINTDMIAGLPADTEEGFCRSLEKVLALAPENVTVHTLSLKRGSEITLNATRIPDENEVRGMLSFAAERLRGAGYRPYYLYRQKFMSGGFENVGWCLPGTENIYNVCIMEELCTVLALGGGASTKLVDAASGRIERVFNAKYPKEYIDSIEKINAGKKRIEDFYSGKETL